MTKGVLFCTHDRWVLAPSGFYCDDCHVGPASSLGSVAWAGYATDEEVSHKP